MQQSYEQFENFSALACIHWKLSSGMVQSPSDKKHGTHEAATSAVQLMDSVLFRFIFFFQPLTPPAVRPCTKNF